MYLHFYRGVHERDNLTNSNMHSSTDTCMMSEYRNYEVNMVAYAPGPLLPRSRAVVAANKHGAIID